MKKYFALTLIFLCLGTFSWAQGTKTTLFDVVKSQQELEIMKQILGTTLSFVAQNIQRQQATAKVVNTPFGSYAVGRDTYRYTNMNAFYLYGQGAVFVIPTSNLRSSGFGAMNLGTGTRDLAAAEREIEAASRQMEAAARALERGTGTGITGGIAGGVLAPPPPPPPPATPQAATPVPPAKTAKPAQVSQEELRKRVAEAQERVKKVREDSEANRAKFLQSLGEIKSFLIEALANHGDSLTTVKPNEFITVVIMTDDYGDMFNWTAGDSTGDRTHEEVISVQKSWITDYKAGRLTLDAFKQKAIQYAQ